jgi:hypothetical protein
MSNPPLPAIILSRKRPLHQEKKDILKLQRYFWKNSRTCVTHDSNSVVDVNGNENGEAFGTPLSKGGEWFVSRIPISFSHRAGVKTGPWSV